jgi:hypothetical protein
MQPADAEIAKLANSDSQDHKLAQQDLKEERFVKVKALSWMDFLLPKVSCLISFLYILVVRWPTTRLQISRAADGFY